MGKTWITSSPSNEWDYRPQPQGSVRRNLWQEVSILKSRAETQRRMTLPSQFMDLKNRPLRHHVSARDISFSNLYSPRW